MEPLPETIRIRVSKDDKAAFEVAAKHARLSLSAWCRQALAEVHGRSFMVMPPEAMMALREASKPKRTPIK